MQGAGYESSRGPDDIGNIDTGVGGDDMITIRKSELVDMVSKIVANIVNKK